MAWIEDDFGNLVRVESNVPKKKLKQLEGIQLETFPTDFGQNIRLPSLPKGCGAVMIMFCRGYGGRQAESFLCLTHQVYVKKVIELLEKYPDIRCIEIAPIKTEEMITIWEK